MYEVNVSSENNHVNTECVYTYLEKLSSVISSYKQPKKNNACKRYSEYSGEYVET